MANLNNSNEIWKDIPGYEGYYQASSLGRIKSLGITINSGKAGFRFKEGRVRKLCIMPNGYHHIFLHKERVFKQHYVHRLIAQTFIENPENKRYVNHINGIKTDNAVDNLEWCTGHENMRHAAQNGLLKIHRGEKMGRSVLTEKQAQEIKDLSKMMRVCDVMKRLNIPDNKRHLVANIACGRIWKHLS